MTDAPSTIPPNDEKIACLAASVAGRVDFPRGESSNIPLAKPDVILIFASMRPAFILSNILACVLPVFAYSLNASQAVRKADCASDWHALSFTVENDFRFSDRYYTNGLKLSYTQSGSDFWTSRLQFALLNLFAPDGAQAYESVSIGQAMYVPSDISTPNPPETYRPYAGWLYASFGAHVATRDTLDSFTVNLGVVGPISLAEDTQKLYHSVIDADWPMGWHTQIKNEPGIVLSYRHSQRLVRERIGALDFDAIGSAAADLGNVLTQGEVRAFMRFGKNLPYNFEPNRIDYSSGNDVAWLPEGGVPDWHFYGFAGGAARFVGYDITLDGNTFAHSRSVTPKWLVGEFIAGLSARYESVQLDLSYTLRTAEFNGQGHPVHMFWSATLKYVF